MKVVIKVAQDNPSEIDTLSQLVNSAYRGESSMKGWTTEAHLLGGQRVDPERISELIKTPENYILKALVKDEIVGCVHLEKIEDDCYLGMLTVKPTLQTGGIGRQILLASEAHALIVMKCKTVTMSVISTRKELIDWYLRRGYSLTGETKPFPMEDQRFGLPKVKHIDFVVLRKSLS